MEKPTGVIQKIIESLQQINTLDVYSPIEKDIILHNLRAAYMIFQNVKEEKESVENRVEKLFIPEPEIEEIVVQENIQPLEEDTCMEEIEEDPQAEEMEEEVDFPEAIEEVDVQEKLETESEIIPEPEVEQPQPLVDDILEFIPDAKPQPTTLFDEMLFSKPEKKSLNDLLTDKKDDNSLGTKFQQSHIPDLTKAIAINEKFTFIRELFRNNGVEFSNAIQKLNECNHIDDAFALMEDLKHQFVWDTTSSAYLTLCDLVRRRFL